MRNRYKTGLLSLLIVIPFFINAQELISKRVYLFDTFKSATVKMKSGSLVEAKFNYDGNKQEMVYYANEQLMILEGIQQVDTIYIEKRKFIPSGKVFREIINLSKGEVQIEWKFQRLYKGKKGAYGVASQNGTVQNFNPRYLEGYLASQPIETQSNQVYTTNFKNDYYLVRNGNAQKFNSLRSLLKLFPENSHNAIQSYIKEQKLNMSSPDDVIRITEFCISL